MPTVGSVPGDPDGVAVSTTNESTITVWLQYATATTRTTRSQAGDQLDQRCDGAGRWNMRFCLGVWRCRQAHAGSPSPLALVREAIPTRPCLACCGMPRYAPQQEVSTWMSSQGS